MVLRRLPSGDIVYFRLPLSKCGYVVTDDWTRARLLRARRRADIAANAATFGAALASWYGISDFSFVPLLFLLGTWVIMAQWCAEAIFVGPLRRDLSMVEDTRSVVARYASAYLATPRDRFATGMGLCAAVWFFAMGSGWVDLGVLLLLLAPVVIGFVVLMVLDRSAESAPN